MQMILSLWNGLKQQFGRQKQNLTTIMFVMALNLALRKCCALALQPLAMMYFFMNTTAEVVKETGIRSVLSRGLAGVSPTADQALVENADLFRTWNGFDNDRIKVLLGPHAPYTCPDAYMEKVISLSHELNCGIHMHLSETKGEVENVMKATGKTPIAHMHELGLFWNTTLAAHCVHVTDEDMAIMAENNVAVAHNPQSNLKLASGIAPVPEMIGRLLTVGLGTDGSASNNNADYARRSTPCCYST